MATAFAQQLRQIAVNSTNELDLKARREAHAESLIFERNVAVKQDWETLYQICIEGFQELCLLDGRLKEFERNLFGYQSKDQDREQLNKAQNEALDSVIESCLEVLGSRLALRPGIKALEWLVRRFRIHIYNASALITTLLPYHEAPLFQNVLSIIPATKLVGEWKFLRPYHQNPSPIPRHAIVYTATTNDGFFSALNRYTLSSCQDGSSNPAFLRFWSSIIVEAVAARLNQAKSGRREIQTQRTNDVLHKVLPIINDGLELEKCPDMTIACFTICLVIASTGLLADNVIDSLIETIAGTMFYPGTDVNQALVCISILAAQQDQPTLPGRAIKMMARLDQPIQQLQKVRRQYSIFKLLQGLVRGISKSSEKKHASQHLSLLHQLLEAGQTLCDNAELVQLLIIIVSHLQRLDLQSSSDSEMYTNLRSLLQELYDSGEHNDLFTQLAALCQQHSIDLEAMLEATVPQIEQSEQTADAMDLDEPIETESTVASLIADLPASLSQDNIFFVPELSPAFIKLLDILEACLRADNSATKFAALDLWARSAEGPQQYVSFLLRVACGHFAASTRVFAVILLADKVLQIAASNFSDLLPYASIWLAHRSHVVRRQTANLILLVEKAISDGKPEGEQEQVKLILNASSHSSSDATISTSDLSRVLQQVYLPRLEEFTSDPNQIHVVLQHALNGSSSQHQSPAKSQPELKKSLRHNLLECLVKQARASPLLSVKLGIIRLVEGVGKVGSTTKNESLSPVLLEWIALSPEESLRRARTEHLELAAVDATMSSLVSAKDKETLSKVVKTVEANASQTRTEVIDTIFDRLASTWGETKVEAQQPLSKALFDLSFASTDIIAHGARSTLKKVSLSTESLKALMESCLGEAEVSETSQPAKRRKMSHDDKSSTKDSQQKTREALRHLSLTLELVEASRPESRPELLPVLFETLVLLRRLRSTLQSESPFALGLCIGCLVAIVDQAKHLRRPQLDMSSIRADIVIECVRNTESPQVQSDAVMLSASLAELAPDRVVHHVMPIFTFMGNKMMSLDDGHSVNVINQAIDRIIPPLVAKLKQQDQSNLIQSTIGLLSSFVTAFDHIPQHRRVRLYQRLLHRLGVEDFGFALSAMLATAKSVPTSRSEFVVSVMSDFKLQEQLTTYSKIISLIGDIYADKPHDADSLLHIDGASSPTERLEKALALFSLAESLLRSKHLKMQLVKLGNSDGEAKKSAQDDLKDCLHQILDSIRTLKPYGEDMATAASKCLTALLELLPLSHLIELLPSLLEEMDQEDQSLKPEALNVLAAQTKGKVPLDARTATAALDYLTNLDDILRTTESDAMRAAAVACVDKIVSKYGRKNPDPVVAIAATLAGGSGLGASHSVVQQRSAVTLASIFDILKGGAVPIVAETLTKRIQAGRKQLRGRKRRPTTS